MLTTSATRFTKVSYLYVIFFLQILRKQSNSFMPNSYLTRVFSTDISEVIIDSLMLAQSRPGSTTSDPNNRP